MYLKYGNVQFDLFFVEKVANFILDLYKKIDLFYY